MLLTIPPRLRIPSLPKRAVTITSPTSIPPQTLPACHFCRATSRAFSTSHTPHAKKSKSKSTSNNALLPSSPARTRFAPSPTGYLHLGSLRTALFNYLLARRTGGQFILRVEDTDQRRTIADAEERLYEDLRWVGLDWDEGPGKGPYGPYRQSERTNLYATETTRLLSTGAAYRCFCTPARLDELARHRNALGLPPIYDGACRHIIPEESEERAVDKKEPFVVRLRVKEGGYPMFDDLVFGRTGYNRGGKGGVGGQIGDPILIKSDGHPTYHLANVVDDHFMKVTHVIRGTEWMSSTPMHMALYSAFDWQPPVFAHVPLLCDVTGAKLSKRNNDIDIASFRRQGVLPEALANFTALLGWSHGGKSDVFGLRELEERFDLRLTKGNTIVAFEKLWFLQKAHSMRYAKEGGPGLEDMVGRVAQVAEGRYSPEQLSQVLKGRPLKQYIERIFREGARNYTTPEAFIDANASFFTSTSNSTADSGLQRPPYTPTATTPEGTPLVPLSMLHTAAAALCLVPETHWDAETHKSNIEAYTVSGPTGGLEQKQFKKELWHYLRWALSGGAPGIGIPATMAILGREECVRRLEEGREVTGQGEMGVGMGRRVPKGEGNSKFGGCGCGKGKEGEAGDKSWMGSLAGRVVE